MYIMIRITEIETLLVQYSITVNPFKIILKFTFNKKVLVIHYSSDFQTNVIIPMQFVSFHKLDISRDTIYIFHKIETIISQQDETLWKYHCPRIETLNTCTSDTNPFVHSVVTGGNFVINMTSIIPPRALSRRPSLAPRATATAFG